MSFSEVRRRTIRFFYLGVDHLTFDGGGGWFWKKNSCKAILNKKKYLH